MFAFSLLHPEWFQHWQLFYIWLPTLIGVPVLIHLINLLRHRRVRWATMAFLLESQKKNQNWIRFKEILLLLLRMLAVAAIVLMLAGLLLDDPWSRLLSGSRVHHVLLIDDSLSMSDQADNATAMDNARRVAEHVLKRTQQHRGTHLVSLMRFSDAAAGGNPSIVRQRVRADLPQQQQSILDLVRSSQTAAGPLEALKSVKEKLGIRKDENLVVYVISDFRARQWREAPALVDAIRQLTADKAQVELVRCVDQTHPNLAITSLAPGAGVLAADVPIKMNVEVTNYDKVPRQNVQVLLDCQTNSSANGDPVRQALPAVIIDRIEPGQTARQSFSARFPTAGDHEIFARLASDALPADNQRFCVVRLPSEVPVLIVDGQPGSTDARLLSLALSPRQRVRTGIKVQMEGTAYLREQPLEKFGAVYLVNIATLDAAEVTALDNYVAGGGGVVFFAGDATRAEFVNQSLYRDGEGIFPLPLVSQASLIVDRLDKVADVDVNLKHPIFQRTFAGHRNSFLSAVLVDRYFASPKDWAPKPGSGVQVLATLRNKAPLIVERRHGRGVCLAVLTTAAPTWNNWARSNPSFVIAMLETHVYLSADRFPQPEKKVGDPLRVELDKAQYAADVQFSRGDAKEALRDTVAAVQDPAHPDRMTATYTKMTDSGIYEAWLTRFDGQVESRRFAANIPNGEGDLAVVLRGDLQTAMSDVSATVRDAAEFFGPITQQAGLNSGQQWWFMLIVLGILIGEQLLAYSASYHSVPMQGRR